MSAVSNERPAAVIADDAEALEVARKLVPVLAAGALRRDADRELPWAELEALSASGLLGITVPAEYGGADVGAETLAEVIRLLASGDPNVAQISQSHFAYVNVLKRQGSAELRKVIFADLLAGRRLGNAQSEAKTRHLQDIRTRLVREPAGGFRLDGERSSTARAHCSRTGSRSWPGPRTTSCTSPSSPRPRRE
jgi:alkylation response protein AidB-like acyl-CoA dehydrogenase